jgi:hypothetical protein
VHFEDHDVRPGASSGYRLRDARRAFAESWVSVPLPAALAIHSARQSGPGRVRVEFTAAPGVEAEVALFDISGRRHGRVRVIPAGEAVQACEVPAGRALSSGLYLVLVDSGGQRAQRRLVITR